MKMEEKSKYPLIRYFLMLLGKNLLNLSNKFKFFTCSGKGRLTLVEMLRLWQEEIWVEELERLFLFLASFEYFLLRLWVWAELIEVGDNWEQISLSLLALQLLFSFIDFCLANWIQERDCWELLDEEADAEGMFTIELKWCK